MLPLIWSCTEPDEIGCNVPCEVVLMLTPGAKEFMTPYQGFDRVVYEDSLSQEFVFDLRIRIMKSTSPLSTGGLTIWNAAGV